MHNLQGKLLWVIARPLLLAIWFILPLSATYCQAQCWNGPVEGPLPSVTPPINWTAGGTYLVTIIAGLGEGSFSPNCGLAWVITYANFFPNQRYIEDPNVAVSNLTYISPTEIQVTVAFAGNASGNDVLAISWGQTLYFMFKIQGSAANVGPCDKDCQAQWGLRKRPKLAVLTGRGRYVSTGGLVDT